MDRKSLAMRVTRREFVLRVSALGGAAAAAPLFSALAAVPNLAAPLQVIIVGAGLAGLCAAYELERRGHRHSQSLMAD